MDHKQHVNVIYGKNRSFYTKYSFLFEIFCVSTSANDFHRWSEKVTKRKKFTFIVVFRKYRVFSLVVFLLFHIEFDVNSVFLFLFI